ncbi:SDR family oxidoreductase [candidate division KSB1 bacterium]|nr:SDR family oxidoreductase [candidate division KSB1 bacterium]RQW09447.1 MAG: SDR family oxidoreductase [candidate division KSB1 bacterium]
MKVLFIGGTGVISSACSQAAFERGIDLYLLNRGQTSRSVPKGAKLIKADARQRDSLFAAVQGRQFDAVVDWIAFTPDHVQMDVDVFAGRTGQFIFISSASAYQKPPPRLPITEETPLENPFWQYSRDKIACERLLMQRYEDGFPTTIVRPSHTYDRTLLPCRGGWTTIDRMRNGQRVVIHGDGTSLWTLTHHRDFARGFIGLLGNEKAIGQAYHITSDEWLTWNQIYATLAQAAGATVLPVYVPSTVINEWDAEVGAGLLGDKMHSLIFDNSKIKSLVPDFSCTIPFAEGATEMIAWYDANPALKIIDDRYNNLTEKLLP